MNQVSRHAASCLFTGDTFRQLSGSGYTAVAQREDGHELTLHDLTIAVHDLNTDRLLICLAGWPTMTTKQRLNAVLSEFKVKLRLYQKKGQMYFGDRPLAYDETVIIDLTSGDVSYEEGYL